MERNVYNALRTQTKRALLYFAIFRVRCTQHTKINEYNIYIYSHTHAYTDINTRIGRPELKKKNPEKERWQKLVQDRVASHLSWCYTRLMADNRPGTCLGSYVITFRMYIKPPFLGDPLRASQRYVTPFILLSLQIRSYFLFFIVITTQLLFSY